MRTRLLALAAILLAVQAYSAEPPQSGEAKPQAPAEGSRPATVKMEAVEIKGEYENPDVFFIIPRRKASMDLGNLMIDYSKEIAEPLLPHRFAARYGQKSEGAESR